jgi:hypothetical protein
VKLSPNSQFSRGGRRRRQEEGKMIQHINIFSATFLLMHKINEKIV